jgi:RNA polymerase sigma factor (sigma-70 family)
MLGSAAMSAIETQAVPDERLARALTAGENAAFEELYRRYAQRLTAYGARLLGDASGGEDVAQIALLNAYQALCRGAQPTHVRAWLFRIAHNAALEILSRRPELVEFDEGQHPSGDRQEAVAARGALLSALATLPERQRAAYLLREVRGLRMAEIGEGLGLSQEQVEQALFAARNRLAEQLAFGERLDCERARDLGGTELHRANRRALKRHLRSCVSCRADSARGGRPSLLAPLTGLRDLLACFAGGAAAPAAKVGAVAAAAALTVGTPMLGGSRPSEGEPSPTPRPAVLRAPGIDVPAARRAAPKPKPRPPARVAAAAVSPAPGTPVTAYSLPAPAEPTPPAEITAPAEQPVAEAFVPAVAAEEEEAPAAEVPEQTTEWVVEGEVPPAEELPAKVPEETTEWVVEEEIPPAEELPAEEEAEAGPAEPVDAYAEESNGGEEGGAEEGGGVGDVGAAPDESEAAPTAVESVAAGAQLSP